jgi:biopolymer transport protein ExbD
MSYLPSRPRRPRHDFSLTVINIVFLLLLFYLATGSLIKRNEVETDVPVTLDLPLERLPRPLLLIAADHSLSLDGAPLTMDELPAMAREAVSAGGFLNVLADRSMAGRDFLEVLARVDTAGVPVRIVTMRETIAGAGP